MKKTIYILFALLFVLASCVQELTPNDLRTRAEETGLVEVKMELTIPSVQIQALTKANEFSHKPQIDYIRVAVFGTSGYPQAYNLAEPVGTYASENGVTYEFKVLLPIYEGEAHVHIIANGDETIPFVSENSDDMDEESIMTAMHTKNNVGAFWARIILPDGILPKLNDYGIYQTDGDTGNFIPSDETQKAFEDLVLIRNFAEVTLTLAEGVNNLNDISWQLVNVPTKGSVAPMSSSYDHLFVDDYKAYEYDTASGRMKNGTKTYSGYTFSDDPMDYTFPTSKDVELGNELGDSGFLYERVMPADKATCVLVRGKFGNDNYYTYYRLDLTNESVGGYFPIYRNYKYQMKIRKVNNRGAKTPTEAMNRDSGGNVSQSTEARKLTDISDGVSRLYVEYVEKNFTSGGKKGLWVYYKPDVANNPDLIDNSSITVTVKTPEQGDPSPALVETTPTTLTPTAESSQTGKYFYEFNLNEQDENDDLVSILKITANNGGTGDERSTMYRDITLRVMHKMDMTLTLVPKQVAGQGDSTVLNIGLPDGLPSSMFPLEIYIEDINHTIYSTGYDGDGNEIIVPVKSDKSIVDGTTNSFYFIRTVNEDEYQANHTITTQFKTNKDASATTIYVANEYFKTKSVNLLNNGMYYNPEKTTVPFNTTSVTVEVEFAEPTGKSWTVANGSGISSITDEDGAVITGGTGNGKFVLHFPPNNSTTATETRTATIRYNNTNYTVTIIQNPLEFTVTTDTPTVSFNASGTVTVHAAEGMSWTASISGPNGLTGYSLSETSGTGTKTLTVTLPTNATANPRNFTVTATMTNPAATATATITQRRGPASPYTFNASAFTLTNNAGEASSSDGLVTVSLVHCTKDNNNYVYLLEANSGYTPGTITVTPASGIKITQVVINYYSNYYSDSNPTISTGSYSLSGSAGTWNLSNAPVTGPKTLTISKAGYDNFAVLTSIQVTYQAIQ